MSLAYKASISCRLQYHTWHAAVDIENEIAAGKDNADRTMQVGMRKGREWGASK